MDRFSASTFRFLLGNQSYNLTFYLLNNNLFVLEGELVQAQIKVELSKSMGTFLSVYLPSEDTPSVPAKGAYDCHLAKLKAADMRHLPFNSKTVQPNISCDLFYLGSGPGKIESDVQLTAETDLYYQVVIKARVCESNGDEDNPIDVKSVRLLRIRAIEGKLEFESLHTEEED